jgi:amino-acid N-acetyltransferase
MSEQPAFVIARVEATRLPDVVALLQAANLPTSDLSVERMAFFGAFDGDRLVGTIGLERVEDVGLLRSMAVEADRRGSGIARMLYERLLAEARRAGIADLYCLTTTADGYFTRLGFVLVPRSEAPTSIQGTAEFSTLCPASTRLYARRVDWPA